MAHGHTSHRKPRVVSAGIVIVAAVLLGGCPAQNPIDGRCPNMEAIVSSIDWIGDGTPNLSTYNDKTGGGDYPCSVDVYYEASDGVEVQRQVEDRLKSFPSVFTVENDSKYSVEFVADDWRVAVGVHRYNDERGDQIGVFIWMIDRDNRAAEILAPIVDVLGTVPDHVPRLTPPLSG
jgi:hypothetical protein